MMTVNSITITTMNSDDEYSDDDVDYDKDETIMALAMTIRITLTVIRISGSTVPGENDDDRQLLVSRKQQRVGEHRIYCRGTCQRLRV
jgi:hypothetical protein